MGRVADMEEIAMRRSSSTSSLSIQMEDVSIRSKWDITFISTRKCSWPDRAGPRHVQAHSNFRSGRGRARVRPFSQCLGGPSWTGPLLGFLSLSSSPSVFLIGPRFREYKVLTFLQFNYMKWTQAYNVYKPSKQELQHFHLWVFIFPFFFFWCKLSKIYIINKKYRKKLTSRPSSRPWNKSERNHYSRSHILG